MTTVMVFDNFKTVLNNIVGIVEIILNFVGVAIIIYSVIKGSIVAMRGEASAKHYICAGISKALNYNLATETLKIIMGRELKDLFVIGGILILKAMITALFMLEMRQDEMQVKHLEKEKSRLRKKDIGNRLFNFGKNSK